MVNMKDGQGGETPPKAPSV